MTHPPLVAHLLYRLDFGGLETLLVECINRIPAQKYRHAIICLTDYTEFAKRIEAPDVQIIALNKPPGLGLGTHIQLLKHLRSLRPTILHTYNLAAIEYSLAAAMTGVPIRIHAEHGRDAGDPFGQNRKHNLLRRLLVPVIDCYVPVSCDLQHWLKEVVGIPDAKSKRINNGVNTETFTPKPGISRARLPQTISRDDFVIGTVGRVQDVKNHLGLIDAFIELRRRLPSHQSRLRLAIIGDGPLLPALKKKITDAGIADVVWLAGARNDIAEIIPAFSVFVLSSIAEGTPVTLLEAMA
ncbi:MAG TPA: glycosyltransferase, partial [Noviherbaspirillum sp.]|nr:glycosyltransferase [Noviherbaspirillum sp.]